MHSQDNDWIICAGKDLFHVLFQVKHTEDILYIEKYHLFCEEALNYTLHISNYST